MLRFALAPALVAACGSVQLPAPGPDCPKVDVHATVRFDASRMWAEDQESGARMRLEPRSDAHWVFVSGQQPALVDEAAGSIIYGGDIIYTACHDNLSDIYFIGPDDVPNHQGGA